MTRSRRVALVSKLADYARAQAAQAKEREAAWGALMPRVSQWTACVWMRVVAMSLSFESRG